MQGRTVGFGVGGRVVGSDGSCNWFTSLVYGDEQQCGEESVCLKNDGGKDDCSIDLTGVEKEMR